MQKSLLAEHLLICAMSLVVALASPAYSQQAKHEPKSNAYPDVAYRGAQFWGTHCDRVGTAQTSYEEIYMVHPWINDWQKGGKHQVEVAEFFSGRVYAATLTTKGNYGVMVESGDRRIELNCASKRSLGGLGKEYPVDRDGSYIERVGVDESGEYGIDRVTAKCEVGAVCDIGVGGLVRYDASGNEVWARLLAVRDKKNRGHPTYRLPNIYKIDDTNFSGATLLSDGTLVLSYQDHIALRFNLKNGSLLSPHPDVSVVDLSAWAQLKKLMYDRAFGDTRACDGARPQNYSAARQPCGQSEVELYFYTLRAYLFPVK